MASSLLLRTVASSSALFNRLINPVRSTASVIRSFNTNAWMTNFDDDDRDVDVGRSSNRSVSPRSDSFFSDVMDPFSPPRSLSQMLNLMDQVMDTPFLKNPSLGTGFGIGSRRAWDLKEDNDGLYIRMDMPGVNKENVKVSVEQNTLTIKGEGDKESEDEEHGRRYSSRLDLPPKLYKIDQIKAEMKNGVLKVHVPKLKEDKRKDVFQVKIE